MSNENQKPGQQNQNPGQKPGQQQGGSTLPPLQLSRGPSTGGAPSTAIDVPPAPPAVQPPAVQVAAGQTPGQQGSDR